MCAIAPLHMMQSYVCFLSCCSKSLIHEQSCSWKKRLPYDNEHGQENFTAEKFVATACNQCEALCKAYNQKLLPSFKPGKPLKVVDLGCGPGSSYIAVEVECQSSCVMICCVLNTFVALPSQMMSCTLRFHELQALRVRLGLPPAEYYFVDSSDWKLQLQAVVNPTACTSAVFAKENIDEQWWQNTPLDGADLIIRWYIHDLFGRLLNGKSLHTLVSRGATVLYGSPSGWVFALMCAKFAVRARSNILCQVYTCNTLLSAGNMCHVAQKSAY